MNWNNLGERDKSNFWVEVPELDLTIGVRVDLQKVKVTQGNVIAGWKAYWVDIPPENFYTKKEKHGMQKILNERVEEQNELEQSR